jgi:hypothetical protein
MRFVACGWSKIFDWIKECIEYAIPRASNGHVIHIKNSNQNHLRLDSLSLKYMNEIPVSPEITTWVVDIGKVNIKMQSIINALQS